MTRDGTTATFEDYAAARAAWLHRTAYVLTGQRADADGTAHLLRCSATSGACERVAWSGTGVVAGT